MMLPQEPQTFDELKARFIEAIRIPVDADAILAGQRETPGSKRQHVFDFQDGMRLVVSIDEIEDNHFLHISASGTDNYYHTIKDEGFEGMVEDVLLRVTAFTSGPPGEKMQAVVSNGGILHIMFEVDHEGLIKRVG